MENIEIKDNKVVETLTKELESLSAEGLQEFFKFFYKINHTQGCMISMDQSLAELFHAGKITRDTAINYAEHPDQIVRHL